MKGFRRPFAVFHKNVNRFIILDIRYIVIDIYDVDIKKEGTMTTTATPALPQTSITTWNLDPVHTVAEFKVKHMMITNVKGHFSRISGVLIRDESNPANDRVEATIEAASIETRDEQRDGHLKSP